MTIKYKRWLNVVVKRIVSAVTSLVVLASTASVFSGCSLQEFFAKTDNGGSSAPASQLDGGGTLTNADWLAMVNDAFGMQVDENSETGELDAAKAWGVVGEDEEIDMNAPVNDEFVTKTLMRASGYATVDTPDEEVIKGAIDRGIIQNGANYTDPAQAGQALTNAQDSWAHQEFEQHTDITLAENVIDFTNEISPSDVEITDTGVVLPESYALGLEKDQVLIVPKNDEGQGGAYKVVSTIDHGDGTVTVKSVPATMEEVYADVKASGRFTPDMDKVEAVGNDVTVTVNTPTQLSETGTEGGIAQLGSAETPQIQQLGSNSVSFTTDLGDGFKVTATVKDVALNADIDWSFGIFSGLDIRKIYMAVDYTTEVSLETKEFSTEASYEEALAKKFLSEPSVDVGKMAIYICPGISVNLRVKLSLEASCKLKVTVTTENTKGFEVVGSNIRAINDSHSSADIIITGQVGAYMTLTLALSLDYLVGEVDLLSLDLKVGPTLEAEARVHTEEDKDPLLCIDVKGYLDIDVSISFMKTVMDIMGIDSTITLLDIDYDSSPCKFNLHLENLKLVDACTLDESEEEETTEEATIPTGIFALEKAYLSLDVGTSGKIVIKSLPSGYTASDIVWESTNPSVVSVDANGNVTAVSAGSVGITAKTKDGKYTVSCAVSAKALITAGNAVNSYNDADLIAA